MATLFDQLTASISNVHSAGRARPAAPAGQMLELRLLPGWPEEGGLDWCLRDGNTVAAEGSVRTPAELPSDIRVARVHVWAPARDVLLTSVQLPTRSRSQIARALPFALEDQLVSSPEDLHFTWERRDQEELAVAVVASSVMQRWLEPLLKAHIHPQTLAPATLSRPCLNHSWIVSYSGTDSWIRTGSMSGFGFTPPDDSSVPLLLRKAMESARAKDSVPEAVVVSHPPEGFDPEAWKQALGVEILVEQADFWSVSDPHAATLNLLHGEFAPVRRHIPVPRTILPAVIMIAVWLLGSVTVTTIEWWQLSSRDHSLRTQMTDIFSRTFPDQASLVVDPYRQMQRNLNRAAGSGAQSGLSEMLAHIAPGLAGVAAGALHTIDYRDGAVDLSLTVPSYKDLESVKSALQQSGFGIDVRNSTRNDKGVTARIHCVPNSGGSSS
ncbi:MAG: type II secretion system protein GspL [Acidiferrobacteraceae bacterium]